MRAERLTFAAMRLILPLRGAGMRSAKRIIAATIAILAVRASYGQPGRDSSEAFNRYITDAETRITARHTSQQSFLWIDTLSASQRSEVLERLRRGELVIEKQGKTPTEIPGGLIHDWVGVVWIQHATVPQVISMVRDYDNLARYYSPDVMQSRLISGRGDDLRVFMRLRKHKVVTVVLDTEYAVHYGRLDAAHQFSISRSTRVSEIADPGSANEHALPADQDHGFMWRLNSYWAFEQLDDGILVECEAISLTRNIPSGLGWIVGPFVQSIPRESLQFTLGATRKATNGERERVPLIGTSSAK